MTGLVEMRDATSVQALRVFVELREVYAVYRNATYFGVGTKLQLTGEVSDAGELCGRVNCMATCLISGGETKITVERWKDVKVLEIAAGRSNGNADCGSLETTITGGKPFSTVAELMAADCTTLPWHCKKL